MARTLTVFLAPHGKGYGPLRGEERRALRLLGRKALSDTRLRHAAHATCVPAQATLHHLLEGAQAPIVPRTIDERLAAGREVPCCDDPDLRRLLRQRPIGVKPTVSTLVRADHRAAAMVGARTIWRIQEWVHAHPDGPGLLVVHPVALHLAVWSLTGFVLRDPPSEPHLFKLEVGVSRRIVTFPPGARVAPLPYPVWRLR